MPEKSYLPPKMTPWWRRTYHLPAYDAPVWVIVLVLATFAALLIAGFSVSPLNLRQ